MLVGAPLLLPISMGTLQNIKDRRVLATWSRVVRWLVRVGIIPVLKGFEVGRRASSRSPNFTRASGEGTTLSWAIFLTLDIYGEVAPRKHLKYVDKIYNTNGSDKGFEAEAEHV